MSTPPAKAPYSGGGGGGAKFTPKVFPVPADHGDMAIIHQNSLTNALKYFELRGDKPTTAKVIEQAYEFAAFSSGAHLAKLAKES